ncbi:unnamed protein product, partial [Closterium sp. NIES-65]
MTSRKRHRPPDLAATAPSPSTTRSRPSPSFATVHVPLPPILPPPSSSNHQQTSLQPPPPSPTHASRPHDKPPLISQQQKDALHQASTPPAIPSATWDAVLEWDWPAFFSPVVSPGPIIRRIPPRIRLLVLDAMLIPLRRLAQHPSDTAAHLILLAFPRLVLRLTAATPSQSLTAACALLAQRFISGDWHALFLEASAAATPAARPLNLASARSTATQARLHRAARFAKCGDWSRSLAALEAGEFAPPSSETISSLSSKHPPAPQPLPHWISTFTPDSYPQLSAPLLHLALRSAPRGTAAGPSGCLFYSSPSPLHYRNGPTLHTFESASGVRQGDPCGPFLYALTQQLAILPTQNQFPSIFISSYADDTFLVGPPSIITTAFTALTDRLHSLGLTVQPSKCSIWCPLDWPQGCATPSGVPIAPNGLNVAGVPIGSDGYIISTVQEKLASFTTSLPLLHQLHDPQTASRILSQCVSARPSFLLRTVSPFPEIHDLFSSWDSTLLDHFTQLFGPGYWIPDTEQTKTAQQQVFLPIRLGGFGLRSSASTAPLSYLCSWAQSLPLLSTHFITDGSPLFRPFLSSDTIHRLDEFIPAATAMLPKEVRDRFPSWSHLLPGYPPKLFTHLSQQLEASLLEKVRSSVTSPLRLARLTSLQGPHAGDWLTAAPSSPQLQLTESEWRIAAAIRLGLPIPHLSSAETCACGHPFSDSSLPSHALRCPKNNEPTRVHDAIKHELHRIILELGLVSQLEDHHLLPGRRPDITCRDLQSGTTLALDVSVADSQHGFPHSNAATVIGSAAATRETEKATLYAPSLHARPDVKLLPLALETFGWSITLRHSHPLTPLLLSLLSPSPSSPSLPLYPSPPLPLYLSPSLPLPMLWELQATNLQFVFVSSASQTATPFLVRRATPFLVRRATPFLVRRATPLLVFLVSTPLLASLQHSASALSFAPFPAALYRCPSFRPAPSAPLPLGQLQRCPSALPPFRHSALPSFRSSSFPPFCLSALPHFRPSALSYLTPSPPPLRAGLRVRAEQGRRAGETEQRSAAGEEESRNELRLMSVAPMPVAALAAGRLKGKRGEGGREGGAEKGRGERGSAGGGSGEGGRGGGWGGGEGGRVGGGEWGKWEACSCHQISCLPSLSPPSIFPPFPPRPPTLPLPFSSSPPLSPSLSPPLSSFPLSISPLPNRPADALRELLEPYGELVRSWNLPDWLIHWGHPGNMAVVLLAMGGYGSYLGWQIRLASSPEAKAAARAAHPPIMGFMFLFFAIGATGGLTSLVTTGRPIFESPHAYSGMAGLVLLTIQTAMTALFK